MSERSEKLPGVVLTTDAVKIIAHDIVLAETNNPLLVLEEGIPPVYYIPEHDVKTEYFLPSERRTTCHWKGEAEYFHISLDGRKIRNAAWKYPRPKKRFEGGQGYIAFYPGKMDACYLNGQLVIGKKGIFSSIGWVVENSK